MTADARRTREELVECGRLIAKKGLVVGPGGNISARCGGLMYISASGSSFEEATGDDYVGVDLATGQLVDGSKKPSSEVLMHLACYRKRPEIGAVVHTHPPLAIAVASCGVTLEPLFPDFAAFLGEVPTLGYVIPTTRELAEAVESVIGGCDGLLLTNHGALTVGSNLREALFRTELIEEASRILIAARSLGSPRTLSPAEVEAIRNLGSEKYRKQLLEQAERG
ncbi:MAG: class II aldolase/adducin family protein [Bacillota bacterium]|nr:class II aldolase/adducin family protein [Bacillota bacterium]